MSIGNSDSLDEAVLPSVDYSNCPIRVSLGFLGKKWALLILRDIAFLRDVTFTDILNRNTGITPRVLAYRLEEMYRDGIIERLGDPDDARKVHYRLSRRGVDVIPVLTALINFSVKNYPEKIFDDGKPRKLRDLYPGRSKFMLGEIADYVSESSSD